MMRKSGNWKKWLALGAGGFIALIGGALIALKVLFPPEKIRAIALEKLESAMGRKVRITSASINLEGISLVGLEVSAEPDFEAGTFLHANNVDVRVRLVPLILKREMNITRVFLSDWMIRMTSAPPEKEASDSESSPADLEINKFVLRNGTFEYTNLKTGTRLSLTAINGAADNLRLDRSFRSKFTLAFEYAKDKGTIEFDGDIDPAKGIVKSDVSTIVYNGIALSLKGNLSDFSSPNMDLDVSLPALPYDTLKAIASVPEGLQLPPLKGHFKARYVKDLINIEVLDLKGRDASLLFKGRQTKQGWDIASADLSWQSLTARISGTYTASLDLKVDTARLSLAKLAAAVPKAVPDGLTGNAELHVIVKGTSRNPSLSGKALFDAIGFTVSDQKLSALAGHIDFTPKSLNAGLKGKMNKGDVIVDVAAQDYMGTNPVYKITGKLSELDLATLPSSEGTGKKAQTSRPISSSGNLVIGRILHPNFSSGETKVAWNLTKLTPDLKNLGGSLKFVVGGGEFKDMAVLSEMPLVKIVLMPVIILQKVAHLVKVPLFPKFDKIDFKEITGDYRFANGVMTVQESHLDTKPAYATMRGEADLGKDELRLHISTKLGVKQIAGPVGFNVRGTLTNPSVKLDPTSILKQPAVEQALEQGKKLFEGIFKR